MHRSLCILFLYTVGHIAAHPACFIASVKTGAPEIKYKAMHCEGAEPPTPPEDPFDALVARAAEVVYSRYLHCWVKGAED